MKAYALYTKLPKDHNLDMSMAKPHLTDLSHFFVLRKSRSLMSFLCKTCTVDWVYLRILWHAASCLAFSNRFRPSLWMYTEMRNFINIPHIPCDTMSSWLIPQPSARICLELGQALTVRCTRNMREGTSELNGMDMKMSQNPAKLKDSYGSPPGSLGLLQWRGKA